MSRALQDVVGLAQLLVGVLTNPTLAASLAQSARATALRFTPEAITDRCACVLLALAS